jgi:hypothetical protein
VRDYPAQSAQGLANAKVMKNAGIVLLSICSSLSLVSADIVGTCSGQNLSNDKNCHVASLYNKDEHPISVLSAKYQATAQSLEKERS